MDKIKRPLRGSDDDGRGLCLAVAVFMLLWLIVALIAGALTFV
jgi:hypothetical protein